MRRERERQARERIGRLEEIERREIWMNEIRPRVTTAAHQELARHAQSLGLTILEQYLMQVRFADDLRSGTVLYRLMLNDTGVFGPNTATTIWKGRLLWELTESDEGIVASRPDPTTTTISRPEDAPKGPWGPPSERSGEELPAQRRPGQAPKGSPEGLSVPPKNRR